MGASFAQDASFMIRPYIPPQKRSRRNSRSSSLSERTAGISEREPTRSEGMTRSGPCENEISRLPHSLAEEGDGRERNQAVDSGTFRSLNDRIDSIIAKARATELKTHRFSEGRVTLSDG